MCSRSAPYSYFYVLLRLATINHRYRVSVTAVMDAVPTPTPAANTTTAVPVSAATEAVPTDGLHRILGGPVLEALYRLRAEAWAAEDVIFPERLADAMDGTPGVENWGYLDGGKLVGTIRVSVHESIMTTTFPEELKVPFPESPVGYISRLGIHRDWRRRGLGYTLIDFSIQRLKDLEVKAIQAFSPVPHVWKYMESHGFSIYDSAEIPWGNRRRHATGFYLVL